MGEGGGLRAPTTLAPPGTSLTWLKIFRSTKICDTTLALPVGFKSSTCLGRLNSLETARHSHVPAAALVCQLGAQGTDRTTLLNTNELSTCDSSTQLVAG